MKKIKIIDVSFCDLPTGTITTLYETHEETLADFPANNLGDISFYTEDYIGVVCRGDGTLIQVSKLFDKYEIVDEDDSEDIEEVDILEYKKMLEGGIEEMELTIREALDERESLQPTIDFLLHQVFQLQLRQMELTTHIADMEDAIQENIDAISELN